MNLEKGLVLDIKDPETGELKPYGISLKDSKILKNITYSKMTLHI